MMRKNINVLSLVLLVAFFSSCASEKTNPVLDSTEDTEIRKLVNKIPGVLGSEANWKKKQIVVRLQKGAEVNDEAIFDAIRKANFTPGKRTK
jgi:copper chaperone CopZ